MAKDPWCLFWSTMDHEKVRCPGNCPQTDMETCEPYEMAKRASDLGSRRLTAEGLEIEKARRGLDSAG